MSSSFSKTALLFSGMVLALFSPRHTTAGEKDPIPITNAEWIAPARIEAPSIGMPGVHVHGGTRPPAAPNVPLPIFRKFFVLDETAISCAQVAVCGLGHFELSVNGEKVGDHFLDPPWSDYADTCYYVRFDVTGLLKPGENVLGVMLGNGMYNVPGGRYAKFVGSFGPPKFILSLVVLQGDKQQITLRRAVNEPVMPEHVLETRPLMSPTTTPPPGRRRPCVAHLRPDRSDIPAPNPFAVCPRHKPMRVRATRRTSEGSAHWGGA